MTIITGMQNRGTSRARERQEFFNNIAIPRLERRTHTLPQFLYQIIWNMEKQKCSKANILNCSDGSILPHCKPGLAIILSLFPGFRLRHFWKPISHVDIYVQSKQGQPPLSTFCLTPRYSTGFKRKRQPTACVSALLNTFRYIIQVSLRSNR